MGLKLSKPWKLNNAASSNSSPIKACQVSKSSHVSNTIMGRMHSLEPKYTLDQGGKAGRMDLNTIARPEREPDEGLAAVIADKPDADPHLSAKKLA
jgi:hypothetical protein